MKGCMGHLINLLCPVNCNDPCMWLLLAGEGGLIGSSSLRDPIEKKNVSKIKPHVHCWLHVPLQRIN